MPNDHNRSAQLTKLIADTTTFLTRTKFEMKGKTGEPKARLSPHRVTVLNLLACLPPTEGAAGRALASLCRTEADDLLIYDGRFVPSLNKILARWVEWISVLDPRWDLGDEGVEDGEAMLKHFSS